MDMESGFAGPAYSTLPAALAAGQIDAKMLDDAVLRVLEMKIRMGLFEHPYVDEAKAEQTLSDPASREIARTDAERSAVLLCNEGGLLPLDRAKVKSIAVIGPLADSKRDTLGPWVRDPQVAETVSVLEGLRAKAGPGIAVDFAPGVPMPARMYAAQLSTAAPRDPNFDAAAEMRRAQALAARSDVAVLVLGESANMAGEASSRSTLELPGEQQNLLETMAGSGKPVVLLLMSARPLELRWASVHVPAIMDIWYPGTQGGAAVANLLFGDAVPGGKLPFTWVRDVGQVPFYYAQLLSHAPNSDSRRYWNEESTPLYPFGYGLSYSTFSFANLRMDRSAARVGETVTVSADVHNTGKAKADEVAQLYIHQRYGSASRPIRELKGFQRIQLLPGQTRTVTFQLGPSGLRYWSSATRSWVQEAAAFDVWVGSDSTATLAGSLEIRQ
jgi:beta-glucosidase